jgi:hypothetical protein
MMGEIPKNKKLVYCLRRFVQMTLLPRVFQFFNMNNKLKVVDILWLDLSMKLPLFKKIVSNLMFEHREIQNSQL